MKAEGFFSERRRDSVRVRGEKVMGVLENDQKYILCLYEIAKGSKKIVFMGHLS